MYIFEFRRLSWSKRMYRNCVGYFSGCLHGPTFVTLWIQSCVQNRFALIHRVWARKFGANCRRVFVGTNWRRCVVVSFIERAHVSLNSNNWLDHRWWSGWRWWWSVKDLGCCFDVRVRWRTPLRFFFFRATGGNASATGAQRWTETAYQDRTHCNGTRLVNSVRWYVTELLNQKFTDLVRSF